MKYAVFKVVRKRKMWLIFFFAGIIAGTVYANFKWFDSLNEVDAFVSYWGDRIKNADINKTDFWHYVLKSRMKEILFILLFNLTIAGKVFNCIYLVYLGYSSSMVGTLMTLRYGYRALLVYPASIFPYYIMYGILITYTFAQCERLNETFFKEKCFKSYRPCPESVKESFKQAAVIMVLLIIESMLEAYININVLV